jgi:hypothetical protein
MMFSPGVWRDPPVTEGPRSFLDQFPPMAIAQGLVSLPSSKTLTLPRMPFLSPSITPISLHHSLRISGVSAPTVSGPRPLRCMVDAFDPTIPLEEASTPPALWYTDPSFLSLELQRVFFRGWQAVGELLRW